jgi:Flp pilus assembly protein TadG
MSLRLHRVRDDEQGAVLVIVALLLLALVGMLVLVFDLGRVVAIRRDMVNASDAAVLAAAQQCALGNEAKTPGVASAAATSLISQNDGDATLQSIQGLEDCRTPVGVAPKLLTVNSTVTVDYFFAQIFGLSSGPVQTTATAQWGPVGFAKPVPITVNNATLVGCSIPQTIPPPGQHVDCDLSYPKDLLQEPRWGVLDLSHWNDPSAAPCHVDAATLKALIASFGWKDVLPLNYPTATYDCLDNGLSDAVWETIEGKTLTFPVIDVPNSTGQGCSGADAGCQLDTADVIGFIQLFVPIGGVEKSGSTVIIHAQWNGPSTGEGIPGTGADFGLRAVRLVR